MRNQVIYSHSSFQAQLLDELRAVTNETDCHFLDFFNSVFLSPCY